MSSQQAAAGGGVPLEDRLEPIDVEIEENTKSKSCTVRYKFPDMEKTDKINWSLEGSDGGGFYIRFEVSRNGKIIVLRETRTIPGPKENLVCKKQKLKDGKNYEVQLEKKNVDILLADFFRPKSPTI